MRDEVEFLDTYVKKKNWCKYIICGVIVTIVISLCLFGKNNEMQEDVKVLNQSDSKIFEIEGVPKYESINYYEEDILNGAIPELDDKMIPIVYEDGAWVKADLSTKWYSYAEFNWANVAIVRDNTYSYYASADAGTRVKSTDVIAYFVWIPRFEYKLFNVDFVPTYERMIEVNFVSSDEPKKRDIQNGLFYTHPAFSIEVGTDVKELNGFWIAKFEPSLNEGVVEILPNRRTLVNLNMASMWEYATAIRNNYGLNIDSRIITNMEYGAIAFLSYSNYGKKNNSQYSGKDSLIFLNTSMGSRSTWDNVGTGCSAGTAINDGSNRCPFSYDYPYYGTGASSTGTIYGIYDLAGGSWECVMGIVSDYPIKDNLGRFNGSLPNNPRYYTFYQGSSDMFNYSRSQVGDAMGEVLSNTIKNKTWNGNNAFFATNNYPWVKRGGSFRGGSYSGIFDYGITDAMPRGDKTFRVILSKY